MAEYLEREALLKSLTQECKDCDNNFGYDCEECDYAHAMLYVKAEKAADVQPVKRGKWCPPLMGQGKCDTYCERCHGKIMRNSTGIFEETPFCPHCGADMRGDENV